MHDDTSIGYFKPCRAAFGSIEAVRDDRSVAERLRDVLSESHREDTTSDFRLGLLQGALAIAMPDLVAVTQQVSIRINRVALSKHVDEAVTDLKNTPQRQVRRATPAQRAKPKSRTATPRSKQARRHA